MPPLKIFEVIPDNDWIWSVLEFDGVGVPPDDLSMDEFEEFLRREERGRIFTWTELVEFIRGINQAFSCFIVAVDSVDKITKPSEVDECPVGCIMAVEAFDSSEWIIWSDDETLSRDVASSVSRLSF